MVPWPPVPEGSIVELITALTAAFALGTATGTHHPSLSLRCHLGRSGDLHVFPAPKRPEFLPLVHLSGQGCCTCPFAVAVGKGVAGGTEWVTWDACVFLSDPTGWPSLLLPVRVHSPGLDGESFSLLQVPGRKKSKGPCQQPALLCPLARIHPLWGPGSPTGQSPELQDPEV